MSLHHIDTIPRVELIDTSINRSIVLCSNPATIDGRVLFAEERERYSRQSREKREGLYYIYRVNKLATTDLEASDWSRMRDVEGLDG